MPRLRRYVLPGQPQHVIQRGNIRCPIFMRTMNMVVPFKLVNAVSGGLSFSQEFIRFDACLLKDCPERALRCVTRVIRQGGVAFGIWVVPDLV